MGQHLMRLNASHHMVLFLVLLDETNEQIQQPGFLCGEPLFISFHQFSDLPQQTFVFLFGQR